MSVGTLNVWLARVPKGLTLSQSVDLKIDGSNIIDGVQFENIENVSRSLTDNKVKLDVDIALDSDLNETFRLFELVHMFDRHKPGFDNNLVIAARINTDISINEEYRAVALDRTFWLDIGHSRAADCRFNLRSVRFSIIGEVMTSSVSAAQGGKA